MLLFIASISCDVENANVEWKVQQSFEYTPKVVTFMMMMTQYKKILYLQFTVKNEIVLVRAFKDLKLCLQYAADSEGVFHLIRQVDDFSSIPSFTLGAGLYSVPFSENQFLVTSSALKIHRYVPFPFYGLSSDFSSFFLKDAADHRIHSISAKLNTPTCRPGNYPVPTENDNVWRIPFQSSSDLQAYFDLARVDFYHSLRTIPDYFICDVQVAKFCPTAKEIVAVVDRKQVILLQLLRFK